MSVMGDEAGEDDDYHDDDLDALPDHAFHELQENAIQSTQRPSLNAQVHLPTLGRSISLAGDLGGPSGGVSASHVVKQPAFQAPSSDYGNFDDEMLDGEIFDAAEAPAQVTGYEAVVGRKDTGEYAETELWGLHRYGANQHNSGPVEAQQHPDWRGAVDVSFINGNGCKGLKTTDRGERVIALGDQKPTGPGPQDSEDVSVLQSEVQKVGLRRTQWLQRLFAYTFHKLLREREVLQQAVQDAKDDAYSKAGEVAIVRANALKVEKDFENRTMVLQKLHADEAARQKMEVEKARAELQKTATEKDFLENDLAEGTKQIRNLKIAVKKGGDRDSETKTKGKENQPVTPKKNKALAYADGFDDEEIQPMSPSRLVIRSKANTPKAGAKRKRKCTETSPVIPLELTQPIQIDSYEESAQPQRSDVLSANEQLPRPAPVRQDQKFKV